MFKYISPIYDVIIKKEGLNKLKQSIRQLQLCGLSYQSIISLVNKHISDSEIEVPISIFTREFGALEAVVVFLRECHSMKYAEIGQLLARSPIVIGNTYRAARRKSSSFIEVGSELTIPLSLFADRTSGVQRRLVSYLRDVHGMSFSEISRKLSRDPRTIWTAYHAGKAEIRVKIE